MFVFFFGFMGSARARVYVRELCTSTSLAAGVASFIGYLLIASTAVGQTPVPSSNTNKPASNQAKVEQTPNEPSLSSYDGQKVVSVSIAGRPDLSTAQFESLFVQKPGTAFSEQSVRQTVAALEANGHAEKIHVQVDPQADGLRVLLVLEPAVYFGIFEFPGAERFAYSRLVQVANYPPQAPFNANDVEQDRNSLLTFFRQSGYFEAEVTPETKLDAANGLANLFFHVNLKRAARFGAIDLEGVPADADAKLTQRLRSLMARLRGAGIRTGKPYHRSTLTKATQFLNNELAKEGRLNAQVQLEGAEYHADTNRADIHFKIRMGAVTNVTVEGAHLFSWTKKSLLPVYQGIGVDEESVEEGRQALVSYFESKGFFDVDVKATRGKDAKGRTLVYQITKGKKHKVTDVRVTGNKALSTETLEPRLTVQEGHFFSHGKFSEKLVRTSVKNLEAVYQSEGFSSVKVVPAVKNNYGDVLVSFTVTEGPRDTVSSLQIIGADTFPESSYAPQGLKLGVGKPYSQALVQADRANIVARYLQAGYLTSSFRETATIVSKSDPHHINVVYQIYEGPQVYAGNVVTLGRVNTKQRLINEDTDGIKTGSPLTETELLASESRLYDHTGVFDWAEVDPKAQITTQTKEDVLVKVHEAKKNQITYGFGFEVINRGGSVPGGTVVVPGLPPVGLPTNFQTSQTTFYGPRGTFQYTRNNLRGKGESFSFTGFAGRLDQRAAVYYIDPRIFWTRWRATTSISAEVNEENPIYSSRQGLGSFELQRDLDKSKKTSLFLRYSFSQTDLSRILIKDLVPTADQHVRLSTVAANVTHDTRDNPLDEHKGMLDSVELDLNTTKLGSSVDFAKLNMQAAYYKQGWHNIVFANSLRIGLAQPFFGSRVPLSEEFFTGGGNSLRGFPLDGAGPQRPVEICSNGESGCNNFINVPSGGNELLVINTEARIPVKFEKGLSIVPFYDGGNVFPDVGFHDFTSLYSNNVGLGLRYSTPVGPIRVDVGRNLNPISGVSATQYFISIGQAF